MLILPTSWLLQIVSVVRIGVATIADTAGGILQYVPAGPKRVDPYGATLIESTLLGLGCFSLPQKVHGRDMHLHQNGVGIL